MFTRVDIHTHTPSLGVEKKDSTLNPNRTWCDGMEREGKKYTIENKMNCM
jgi:hypothetical protein